MGKAAAYALSKEGFYVVLGAHSIVILLLLFVKIDVGCLVVQFIVLLLSPWDFYYLFMLIMMGIGNLVVQFVVLLSVAAHIMC